MIKFSISFVSCTLIEHENWRLKNDRTEGNWTMILFYFLTLWSMMKGQRRKKKYLKGKIQDKLNLCYCNVYISVEEKSI